MHSSMLFPRVFGEDYNPWLTIVEDDTDDEYEEREISEPDEDNQV